MKINAIDSYRIVSVYTITERRDGCVYKTKFKGYADGSRPKQADEMYVGLSTSVTYPGGKFAETLELEPWLEG